jgi:hypothetical protein
VIAYEYPNYEWEKDNFSPRGEYRDLVREVLDDIDGEAGSPAELEASGNGGQHTSQ